MSKIKPFKNIVLSFTVAGVIFINPIIGQAELGNQILREGMRHEDIKILQQHLVDLDYLDLKETTTYYETQTLNAVKDFQKSQGLKANGEFDEKSFKALESILKLEPLVYNRLLKQGLRGKDVQNLQERLKVLGFMNIDNPTTYFGPQTKQALMNFQRSYGLQIDGLAGAETYQALNSNKRKPSASRGGSRNSSHGNNIVATARKHIGTPYAFGTSSANSFDCSGFTHYVYKQHGINIPRSSVNQAKAGSQVSKGNLQAGDLVIFSNTYKAGPSHSGIYIGNDDFIHASSAGGEVMVSNLDSGYYSNHFSYGRRVN